MSVFEKFISEEEIKSTSEKKKVYEKCFIPEQDPELKRLGIEVCARTELDKYGEWHNRISFKLGDKKSEVDCVHTAVCQITPSPESESGFAVVSTEQHPELKEMLDPEDQYFALKSFTQALVERGIQKSMLEGIKRQVETEEEPIDMNHLLRSQLIKALVKVAPEETKELTLSTLEYVTAGVPERYTLFSNDFFDVICHHMNLEEVKKLDSINGGFRSLSKDIKQCIASNPKFPIKFIDELYSLNDLELKLGISNRKKLSQKYIYKLIKDENPEVRLAVATRLDFPPNYYTLLVNDPSEEVRRAIALHDIPLDIIVMLSKDPNSGVREIISKKKGLPDDVITTLASDKSVYVRKAVVEREYITLDAIEKLAVDENEDIRLSLVRRKGYIPDSILQVLSDDKFVSIRRTIAERNDLPDNLILKLALDKNVNVRSKIVEKRDDLSEDVLLVLSKDLDPTIRYSIAQKEGLPDSVLLQLSKDTNRDVLFHIIRNQHLPDDAFRYLLKSVENDYLKGMIATFPSVPEDVLREIVEKGTVYDKEKVSRRKDLPPDLKEKLLYERGQKFYEVELASNIIEYAEPSIELLRKVVFDENYPNKSAFQTLAKKKDLPTDIVDKLADDDWYVTREKIATHPNLSEDKIRKLFNDVNQEVRKKVVENEHLPRELMDEVYELTKLPYNHDNYDLIEALAKNKNLPIDIMKKMAISPKSYTYSADIAERPNLPVEVMELILDKGHFYANTKLADRKDIPEELLEKLARYHKYTGISEEDYQKNESVRKAVAGRWFGPVPERIMRILANDESLSVLEELAKRRDLPEDIILKLGKKSIVQWGVLNKERNIPDNILMEIFESLDDTASYAKSLISERETLPDNVIRSLAQDDDKGVRFNIARRKDTPIDVLKTLKKDKDKTVREMAKIMIENKKWEERKRSR